LQSDSNGEVDVQAFKIPRLKLKPNSKNNSSKINDWNRVYVKNDGESERSGNEVF